MEQVTYVNNLAELLGYLDARNIQGERRSRAVFQFLSRKAAAHDVPIFGSFELTPLCNLNCKMCYVHLTKEKASKIAPLLSVEEWKEIMSQAVSAGIYSAALTGGECLTYPGFHELYLYLYSSGVRLNVLTNGRLLTDETVQFFKKQPPALIQVTLYGSNDDVYERVTGCRAFSEVWEGIQRLKESKLPVKIAMTFCKESQGDETKLLDLVRSLNVPYTYEGAWLDARSECGRHKENYMPDIAEFAEIARNEVAKRKVNTEEEPKALYNYVNAAIREGLPCGGGHSSFQVNWKGELLPCPTFPTVCVPVLPDGLNVALMKMRRLMAAWEPPQKCISCDIMRKCTVCPGQRTSGKLNGKLDPTVCERARIALKGNNRLG